MTEAYDAYSDELTSSYEQFTVAAWRVNDLIKRRNNDLSGPMFVRVIVGIALLFFGAIIFVSTSGSEPLRFGVPAACCVAGVVALFLAYYKYAQEKDKITPEERIPLYELTQARDQAGNIKQLEKLGFVWRSQDDRPHLGRNYTKMIGETYLYGLWLTLVRMSAKEWKLIVVDSDGELDFDATDSYRMPDLTDRIKSVLSNARTRRNQTAKARAGETEALKQSADELDELIRAL